MKDSLKNDFGQSVTKEQLELFQNILGTAVTSLEKGEHPSEEAVLRLIRTIRTVDRHNPEAIEIAQGFIDRLNNIEEDPFNPQPQSLTILFSFLQEYEEVDEETSHTPTSITERPSVQPAAGAEVDNIASSIIAHSQEAQRRFCSGDGELMSASYKSAHILGSYHPPDSDGFI